MSFLKNLEAKLEQLIEGGFKSAFKSEVQPVELARKLVREMDSNKSVSVSRTYVPNEYVIYLSPPDREQFSHHEVGLQHELSLYLLEHARKRGYSLIAKPTVGIETEERLDLGTFGIQCRLADAPIEPASAVEAGHTMVYSASDLQAPAIDLDALPLAGAALRAMIEVGDRRYVLTPPVAVIGRGNEADIRLDDPNISRAHAEFRAHSGGWVVSDLGSTNGTRLDGREIERPESLRSGDRVQVGNTVVVFVQE